MIVYNLTGLPQLTIVKLAQVEKAALLPACFLKKRNARRRSNIRVEESRYMSEPMS